MPIDFFSFYVEQIWGSALLSVIGTGAIFAVIGVLGRMSYFLLIAMLILYFIVFGIGFVGLIIWLPLFLFSVIYFGIQVVRFLQRAD